MPRGDGRPGPARAAVQSRRRAGAELAAGAFGVGQHPRGCRDHRIRGVAAFRFPARGRACCASSSSVRSAATSTSWARWRSATATPPTRRGPGRGDSGRGARHASTAPPRILWLDTGTPGQLVVEVRAMDRLGLLALLTRALERAGADIAWAKVNTFGSTAADVFCVSVLPVDGAAASAGHGRAAPVGRVGRPRGRRCSTSRSATSVRTPNSAAAGRRCGP